MVIESEVLCKHPGIDIVSGNKRVICGVYYILEWKPSFKIEELTPKQCLSSAFNYIWDWIPLLRAWIRTPKSSDPY